MIPTAAERIATRFDNDGQKFEDEHNVPLWYVCRLNPCTIITNGCGKTRFVFPDQSTITICDDAWDIGYPDCYCWQSTGHREECEAK